MSGISSVNGLSNLPRDLYYQYLINNNPTSTMLRSLSGDSGNEEMSGASGLMNTVSTAMNTLSGLSGAGGLTGGNDDEALLGASTGVSDFSGILESYLNAQRAEAAGMAEKLSSVLEEAVGKGEEDSLAYKTVQEVYQYFMEKSAAADSGTSRVTGQLSQRADALQENVSSERAMEDSASEVLTNQALGGDFDFAAAEEQQLQAAEAMLPRGTAF